MSEEQDLSKRQKAWIFGLGLSAFALVFQFMVIPSFQLSSLPPGAAFLTTIFSPALFVLGGITAAIGELEYMLTPKKQDWNPKVEVQKWLEKKNE